MDTPISAPIVITITLFAIIFICMISLYQTCGKLGQSINNKMKYPLRNYKTTIYNIKNDAKDNVRDDIEHCIEDKENEKKTGNDENKEDDAVAFEKMITETASDVIKFIVKEVNKENEKNKVLLHRKSL